MEKLTRLILTQKEIREMTGWSKRTATRKMKTIRLLNHKAPRAGITIDELCAFTNIKEKRVIQFLK